jgi:hypothetical protein
MTVRLLMRLLLRCCLLGGARAPGLLPDRVGARCRTLLVLDDEATISELLSGSLRLAGFDVVTAASGAKAVHAVQSSRPALVLLDVMLPDRVGFEALRRIRSAGCEVPVIFPDRPGRGATGSSLLRTSRLGGLRIRKATMATAALTPGGSRNAHSPGALPPVAAADRAYLLFLNASRRIICHSVGAPSEVVTSIVFLTNRESLTCASRQSARSSLLVKTPSSWPSLTW